MEAQQVPCTNEEGVETSNAENYSKPHLAAIEVEQILHMNGGEGEISYANNSLLQKKMILMTKPIIEESIREVLISSCRECIKVADLGCSSGPNAFLPTWEIIESIDSICLQLNRKELPMLQVFLNDLPGNDFNTIFKSLPRFYEKLEEEKFGIKCLIDVMPGSFYARLFPDRSLNFVCSSSSLHWLSQVPKELGSESGIVLNKGNIHITKTSPPAVQNAYLNQFQKDFTAFLRSRSPEVNHGGRMVLTILNSNENQYSFHHKHLCSIFELIGITLHDMVMEGLIEESKLDSFNVPLYAPSAEEVRQVIEKEGSFNIHRLETFQVNWDANIEDSNKDMVFDKNARAKFVGKYTRAAIESMLATQFGDALIDTLFQRFSDKVADYLGKADAVFTNLVISLVKECQPK